MNLFRTLSVVSIGAVMASAACSSSDKGGSGSPEGGDSGGAGGLGDAGGQSGTAGALGSNGSSGVGGASGSSGSSSTGGSSGSSGNRDCAAVCDKFASLNCSASPPRATCVNDCAPAAVACPTQNASFASCVTTTGTLSCNTAGQVVLGGCDEPLRLLSACAACVEYSTDDECDTCQKTNCCSQRKAFFGSADYVAFTTCARTCLNSSDPNCLTNCENMHPIAGAAFERSFDCTQASCMTECAP